MQESTFSCWYLFKALGFSTHRMSLTPPWIIQGLLIFTPSDSSAKITLVGKIVAPLNSPRLSHLFESSCKITLRHPLGRISSFEANFALSEISISFVVPLPNGMSTIGKRLFFAQKATPYFH